MNEKLESIQQRFEELERLMQNEAVISDPQKIKETGQEYEDLKEIISSKKRLDKVNIDLLAVRNKHSQIDIVWIRTR